MTTPPGRPGQRSPIMVALLASMTAALLLSGVDPAGAHGDDGSMDVLVSRQTGPTTIRIEVSIPYSDGDLADGATVTATLTDPDGRSVATTPVPRSTAVTASYATDLIVPEPGAWLITLRSTRPVAEATVEVTVTNRSAPARSQEGSGSTDTNSTGSAIVLSAGVAAVVLVGGAGLAARRRRRTAG